jgi:hypothetical protein
VKAAALCLSITISCAQSALAQTQGHTLLFHPDSTTILEADQRAIFESLEYVVSADGTSLEVVDCGPIFAQATETDLNGDGLVEVFVLGGNTCTSGMDGSTITLWIKNGDGSYAMNLGFPAGGWTVLETANMGYPDLSIGGAGFCEAVWRWDGTSYQQHGTRETAPGGCDGIG